MKALTVGRFQPFHIGHLRALGYISNREEYVIIGIGSSQESFTTENPFTADEREEMIRNSLRIDRERYTIVKIPDINDDTLWVEHVKKLTPEFNVVYTNGELEKKLFSDAGFNVRNTPFFEREKYSATNIRDRIINNKPWEHLIPEGTLKVMKRIRGDERIRKLS